MYVTAITNLYDNVTELSKVEADTPGLALKKALVNMCVDEESKIAQVEWNNKLSDDLLVLCGQLWEQGELICNVIQI